MGPWVENPPGDVSSPRWGQRKGWRIRTDASGLVPSCPAQGATEHPGSYARDLTRGLGDSGGRG